MRKTVQVPKEVLACDFCGAETDNSITATHAGWEWFTGHRPMTFHACARCYQRRRAEYDALQKASETKPVALLGVETDAE